jgi:hypothetical protein
MFYGNKILWYYSIYTFMQKTHIQIYTFCKIHIFRYLQGVFLHNAFFSHLKMLENFTT